MCNLVGHLNYTPKSMSWPSFDELGHTLVKEFDLGDIEKGTNNVII